MKTLNSLVQLVIVAIVASYCTGCLSIWSQQLSMDELRRERIYASGNQEAIDALKKGASPAAAIKAVRLGDGAGIGIDVTNLEALGKNPVRQILAAVGDAAIILGTKEAIDSLDSNDSNGNDGGSPDRDAGRDATSITVNGDGNTIQVRGDASTIGGPSGE